MNVMNVSGDGRTVWALSKATRNSSDALLALGVVITSLLVLASCAKPVPALSETI